MAFSNTVLSAVITVKNNPELPKQLIQKLGDPTDSYWNGSHTWFSELNNARIEWRLHPVTSFSMPEASRPEDLLDLALEGQIDSEHYWEGLEIFPCDEDEVDINELKQYINEKINLEVDAIGNVNHDEIGDAYEHTGGQVSIVKLLLEQINNNL
ncbi:MAG: hypothetical protein U0R17_04990 [Acidimicrobiia bacterium]